MTETIANEQLRDTNTYTFTMTGPGPDEDFVFQYANNLDADVTIDVAATYDSDDTFSDTVSLGTNSITAGSTAKQSLSDPWDVLVFQITAATTPTSGNVVAKKHG